jgi:hypothetical protein
MARARPFRDAVLPFADEVFLREYRYRVIVFGAGERKYARQISRLGKLCRDAAATSRGAPGLDTKAAV